MSLRVWRVFVRQCMYARRPHARRCVSESRRGRLAGLTRLTSEAPSHRALELSRPTHGDPQAAAKVIPPVLERLDELPQADQRPLLALAGNR